VRRPPVFVDTDAVVAGLPTGNASSPVARIPGGMLSAARPDLLRVTGDKAQQRDAVMRSRVVSPQAFVELP
jgi:hypothetical protein